MTNLLKIYFTPDILQAIENIAMEKDALIIESEQGSGVRMQMKSQME